MEVFSFWYGSPLSTIELLSIKSFQNHGHKFVLYVYDMDMEVPPNTIKKNANDIISHSDIFKYCGSFATFSDIFRYKVLYEYGGIWVDLDMVCIKPLTINSDFYFASERTIQKGPYRNRTKVEVATNAILKATPKSEFYNELFNKCWNIRHKIPKLHGRQSKVIFLHYLKLQIEDYDWYDYIAPANHHCPVDFWNTKEIFMDIDHYPSKYGVSAYTREEILKNCITIHLYRSIIRKRNIDINASPVSLFSYLKTINKM
jgi:hypothetical protein